MNPLQIALVTQTKQTTFNVLVGPYFTQKLLRHLRKALAVLILILLHVYHLKGDPPCHHI